jgi:UDP-N-acetylglucosamine--N-acetylmuramyl-(pentapeptide) pyrophosphoryl-undecaprenol N-acetylglucosamine transferase
MVMAGGTGGHVYPALAVAEQWRKSGGDVVWLGTKAGIEARLVPQYDIPIEWISISGLRGKGRIGLLLAPVRLGWALLQSLYAIIKCKPQVVLGMGGFASGPGGVASWILRKPLLIHEQNGVSGMTNRILSHFSTLILEGFPNTFPANKKVIYVGNPLRSTLAEVPPIKESSEPSPLRLLVLGGSLGAQALNQIVPKLVTKIGKDIELLHQTGEKNFENTVLDYAGLNGDQNREELRVVPYIDDMDRAYSWADLVICRAGAMTVAELAVVGRASILVPFPYAVDDHQTSNGNFLVESGAALMIQQKDLELDRLELIVRDFISNRDALIKMSKRAHKLAIFDATKRVTDLCMRYLK